MFNLIWTKSSHCSWDCGEFRIVKEYCPRRGGIIFKLFNGKEVTYYQSLEEAQTAMLSEMMS